MKTKISKYFTIIFLLILSLLGNIFTIQLFFGVNLIFGSIFAFLLLNYFGIFPTILSILISGAYTYQLWGHPYAMIIFLMEILTVTFFYRKKNLSFIIGDFIYWFSLGGILVFSFYSGILKLDFVQFQLIYFKQAVNGIMNCLLAEGILILFIFLNKNNRKQIETSRAVFIPILLLLLFFLLTLTILDTNRIHNLLEKNTISKLKKDGTHIAKLFYRLNSTNIEDKLNFLITEQNDFLYWITLNHQGNRVFFPPEKDFSKEDMIQQKLDDSISILLPKGNFASVQRWRKGYYIYTVNIPYGSIEIIQPLEEIAMTLLENQKESFLLILLMILSGFPATYLLSLFILKPIVTLEEYSGNLSNAIRNLTHTFPPDQTFIEYDRVSRTLELMSIQLIQNFSELKILKENLEKKVRERTIELNRLSMVAEKTINGIVITNANKEIQWVNEGFTKISGYSSEEVLGKKPGDLLQGDLTDKETIVRIRDALSKELEFSETLINYHKNGEIYWLRLDCNPLYDENRVLTGFLAVETDVTKEKQIEKNLEEQKTLAQEANKSKSMFLANMSHEIRTPMNGILGMSNLLLETNLDAIQKEKVEIIYESATSLLTILNDILDLSKIEAGKLHIEKINFDLQELLKKFLGSMKVSAESKTISLKLELNESIKQWYYGDPIRLRQILINLVGNAIKFTEYGTIKVRVSKDSNNLIFFEVEDTGIGIEETKIKELFKEFNQADGSITRKFGGTGLGLTISKRLVEMMGGRIRVQSTYRRGSTFSFYINLPEGSEEKKPDESSEIKPFLSNKKVLLVEDNIINQKVVTRMLGKIGLTYDIANNGKESIEFVSNNDYLLVLMDCQMPVMDGYQATREIRGQFPEKKELPIIALTANALKEEQDLCFSVGMNDFISKPIFMNTLYNVLKKYITT